MAAETEEQKTEAAPRKKGGKVLIIAIAVVILAGAGAGYYFFTKGSASSKAGHEEAAETGSHGSSHGSSEASGHSSGASSLFTLEPLIVNLQDNSGTRYLKITINLELDSATQEELQKQLSKVRDSLIVLLSSKSYSDVGTVEGKYLLRDEIVARVNQHLTKEKVKTAYFTEFVIQ